METESFEIPIKKDNYKKIEITIGRKLFNEEINLILDLKNYFPISDFYFDTYENKIIFNLNSINLDSFKDVLNDLIVRYRLNTKYENEENIFKKLITEIESIKSYGIKFGKRLYVDYNAERKVKNRKNIENRRKASFYNSNNFSKTTNKIPEEFLNKIICEDSEKLLKKLPDNCIDIVFTSPPYNFGIDYDSTEDGIDWNKYFEKLFLVFDECIRVLKYGGRIIVNIQPLFSDYIPSHHIISDFFMKKNLMWKGEVLWEKHNYNCKYTAWGSWKSPSSPYLKYTWEFLEIFSKGDLKKIGRTEDADITGDEFKKWVLAKWDIAPERNMKEYGHDAMFPEQLVERTLKLFSFKNDIVLDPFNGAGTTTYVAKKFGRKYIGIDNSQKYCKAAQERIKKLPESLDNF